MPPDFADLIAAVLDAPAGMRPVASLPPSVARLVTAAAAGGWIEVVPWQLGDVVTLSGWGAEQLGVRLDDAGRWRDRPESGAWDAHDPRPIQRRERRGHHGPQAIDHASGSALDRMVWEEEYAQIKARREAEKAKRRAG